jgi:hypothetical protein
MGDRDQVGRPADCRRGRRPVSVRARPRRSVGHRARGRQGEPRHLQRRGRRARPQAEWLPYLAELLDAPPPRHVSEEEAEKQIGAHAMYYGTQLRAASNAKAKSELGLTLEYPSWREGFRELFG